MASLIVSFDIVTLAKKDKRDSKLSRNVQSNSIGFIDTKQSRDTYYNIGLWDMYIVFLCYT